MKTVMLMMSLLAILVFSIGCNRSEDRSATGTDIQREEESRAGEFSDDVKEDIQEEEADVREEMEDVREEQQDVRDETHDVEKEELDLGQKYEDAKEKVKDEVRMED